MSNLYACCDAVYVCQVLTTVTFDSPDSAAKVDTISAIVRC